MIQKTVGLRPSKLFQEVLSIAISNAAYAGKKTITAKDVRNIATYRLKCNKGLDPNTVAELRRMATLRGVINSSGDVFMRNGKLNPVAKFTISDTISAFLKIKSELADLNPPNFKYSQGIRRYYIGCARHDEVLRSYTPPPKPSFFKGFELFLNRFSKMIKLK